MALTAFAMAMPWEDAALKKSAALWIQSVKNSLLRMQSLSMLCTMKAVFQNDLNSVLHKSKEERPGQSLFFAFMAGKVSDYVLWHATKCPGESSRS